MSDTNWRSGPPPSIGWWPTVDLVASEYIRWWNGKQWSVPVSQQQAEDGVLNALAEFPTCLNNSLILWRPRPSNWLPRSFT